MAIDMAEMQDLLEQNLANDRVVTIDTTALKTLREMAGATLTAIKGEAGELSSEITILNNVWRSVSTPRPCIANKALLVREVTLMAHEHIPEATLRAKLAIVFAFDHAFRAPSAHFHEQLAKREITPLAPNR